MKMDDFSGVPATERWSYRLIDLSAQSSTASEAARTGFRVEGNKCIIYTNAAERITLTVSDLLGRQIFVDEFTASSSIVELTIPTFSQGCYIASVRTSDGIRSLKFVR
jgi:hypothetical protein